MTAAGWSFHNPVRIDADGGGLSRLSRHVPEDGSILLVTTQGFVQRGQVDEICALLGKDRMRVYAGVTPNPELDDLEAAARELAGLMPAAVVALGGGSALDAAKVLSVTLGQGEGLLTKAFRRGQVPVWMRSAPLIAIPTTAGTGSEVTPFATVWDGNFHRKHSVAGDAVYPVVALLEPSLTLSLPEHETLHSGLDTISHALESLWNRHRSPVSELFSAQALRLALWALPAALASPADMYARTAMQQASALAGMAISQTRTAIAHAISYPLTSHFGVPHGLACSFTLPKILAGYLEENEEPVLRPLLQEVRVMLEGFGLRGRVADYADAEAIDAVRGEMFQPGRADNFVGNADLDSFLSH